MKYIHDTNTIENMSGWDKVRKVGYITSDMNIPINVVISFICDDERNYNKVEENVQIEAIKEYAGCMEWMARPSKRVIEAAIQANPVNIGRVNKPTKEIQLMAVSLRPSVIDMIIKPCQEAKSLAAILA